MSSAEFFFPCMLSVKDLNLLCHQIAERGLTLIWCLHVKMKSMSSKRLLLGDGGFIYFCVLFRCLSDFSFNVLK